MAAALKINTASAMYIDWLMRAIHDWLALADTCAIRPSLHQKITEQAYVVSN